MNVSHPRSAVRARALAAAATAITLVLFASPSAFAQMPPMPKSPVTINIVDVAGDLALTQDAIEAYQKQNPQVVSKFNFTNWPYTQPAPRYFSMLK